ncbi:uncharacterized protein PHACADRAFT_257202, partial [Phanerochaete carnosa HHB-10118-sp]
MWTRGLLLTVCFYPTELLVRVTVAPRSTVKGPDFGSPGYLTDGCRRRCRRLSASRSPLGAYRARQHFGIEAHGNSYHEGHGDRGRRVLDYLGRKRL